MAAAPTGGMAALPGARQQQEQQQGQHTGHGPLGAHGAPAVADGGPQQEAAGAGGLGLEGLTEEEMLQFALQMSLQDLQRGPAEALLPAAGAS